MKRGILLFSILFCLFMFPPVNAETAPFSQCSSDSDCAITEFCEFDNCDYELGEDFGSCVFRPDASQCEITSPVCGCDRQTYQSDCHRKAAGVSRGYFGECIDQISFNDCTYHSDCPTGFQCIKFPELPGVVPPRIGTKCAEPNPCSYFDCSEFGEDSVCVVKEGFYLGVDEPFFPFELLCTGDCVSDDDCEEGEFCEFYPCDFEAGYCTEVPAVCTEEYSPVCGCDGITYSNDCLRKQLKISKNYDGSCIEEISNISCDVDDQYKDTCNPGICIGKECPSSSDDPHILLCIELPGIGRRCAYENVSYPCPDGYELIDLVYTYPMVLNCRCISDSCEDCESDSDCEGTEYVNYGCLRYKSCEGGLTSEECHFKSCSDPNVTIKTQCVSKSIPCPEYDYLVCGCDGITYKNLCFLMEAGAILNHEGECETANITEITCDAQTPCPGSLNCFGFPGLGLRCAKPNPCSYYQCPLGTECSLGLTYPAQVICSGTCEGVECETGVSYDLVTGKIEFIKNNQKQSTEITLYTAGNKGILETETLSVKYSNELAIHESKLMMKTSAGEKQVKILPEDAISVSETPVIESVTDAELKEDAQKPIYSIKGAKPATLLFIIPVSMEIETKVSAETGDVISVNKPWWSFLAW